MATPVRLQKSVDKIRQTFSYCDLCRHSHEQGKRHAFSRRHKDKVKAVLSKFSVKVKAAKQDMKTPCILQGNYEPQTNYWCYMCASEVPKHITDREVTVRHAGFIEHLMSCEHAQKVDRFWRMNRIETALQQKFIFSQDSKELFKKAVEEALAKHEEQQDRLLSQTAAKIRKVESTRLQIVESSGNSTSMFGSESSETFPATTRVSGNHPVFPPGIRRAGETSGAGELPGRDLKPGCSSWSSHQANHVHEVKPSYNQKEPVGSSSNQFRDKYKAQSAAPPAKPGILSKVKTIGVISSGGLTTVNIKDSGFTGNIHSGTTPPWLRDQDEDEDGRRGMGPSEEEFKQHLERQRRSKLNPNRVGANFDHSSPASEAWLPSFGRVWNSGRRLQSKYQFNKERNKSQKRKNGAPSTATEPD
ncbi:coiled-coil domain-containing protein 84-like [Asterias rubens]|uniref:coiled-coil domain-containing protein 84-like n=1 Tax=Asterias rubens TaxID=7604 RepID=UPI001455C2BD|nr:coiled-coil domain-containing protein 84-like [Asterias rubens]